MTATTARPNPRALLTHDETRDLIPRAQAGDPEARATLVERNMGLVTKVAIAHLKRAGSLEKADLLQEGAIGLMKAIERFDTTTGNAFSTYAIWWVRQAISRAVANQADIVRQPTWTNEARMKVRHAVNRLRQELGREPTGAEIAAASGVPFRTQETLRFLAKQPLSLDSGAEGGRDDSPARKTYHELIPDHDTLEPEEFVEQDDMHARLVNALSALDARTRLVIVYRAGLGGFPQLTLEELGRELGITRERVRQIEAKGQAKLRELLEEKEAAD